MKATITMARTSLSNFFHSNFVKLCPRFLHYLIKMKFNEFQPFVKELFSNFFRLMKFTYFSKIFNGRIYFHIKSLPKTEGKKMHFSEF